MSATGGGTESRSTSNCSDPAFVRRRCEYSIIMSVLFLSSWNSGRVCINYDLVFYVGAVIKLTSAVVLTPWFVQMLLTHEQKAILSQHDASFRIIAGAGSGKTTTLTLFVKQAIESGIQASQIAFITFTRLASHEIKSKIRTLIGSHVNICCGTFHKVMFRLVRDAGLQLPYSIKLFDGTMERNVEYVLTQMRLRAPSLVRILQTFRLLVVDE